MAKLGYASPTLGFSEVQDDGTVITDGQINNNAVVSTYEGVTRLDVDGNGIINANPEPNLGTIKVTRVPGWQGALGYRVVLEDWAEGSTPNAIALAIYQEPDGHNYYYTTGAMIWDSVKEEWGTTCPPGFEPGENDIHMGMLYGSLKISAFTMHAAWDEHSFSGGGDWI